MQSQGEGSEVMKKANDSVGCRELQQMLQYGTYQEQEEILRQLRGHVAEATAQAQQTVADEWRMQYKGSGYLKLGAVFTHRSSPTTGNWSRITVYIKRYLRMHISIYLSIYLSVYLYVYIYI